MGEVYAADRANQNTGENCDRSIVIVQFASEARRVDACA